MDNKKKEIQRKLIANGLIDTLKNNERVIIREAWCTQERIIRFTTTNLRNILFIDENNSELLDNIYYEINNEINDITISCVYDGKNVDNKNISFLNILRKYNIQRNDACKLNEWIVDLSTMNSIFVSLSDIINENFIGFEKTIKEMLIYPSSDNILFEGKEIYRLHKSYERNRRARNECLIFHGNSCKICGLNFADAYGSEYETLIEVHHIKPISTIGKEYVVDPIKDLIPVCPNCHAVLHFKNMVLPDLNSLIKKQKIRKL